MRSRSKPDDISRPAPRRAARVCAATTATDVDLPRDRGAGITARLRRVVRAPVAAALLLASCSPYVQGNGVYAEEARQRAPFAGIRAEDGVTAVVTVAPGEPQSIVVIGDSNVVPHVETEVEPALAGTATVAVLRVWVSTEYGATIPPTVVVAVPALAAVEARGGAAVEASRAGGADFTGPPLHVTLVSASVDADAYPVAGAIVALSGRGTARLRSSGPVTGSAAGEVRLVVHGEGGCDVEASGGASVVCE